MTDKLFADTNLLIYMYDGEEPLKRTAALAWYTAMTRTRTLVVSVQVLNEFYVVASRRFPLVPREHIRLFVDDLRLVCTAPLDFETIVRARHVQDQSNYGWYDCLIIASAINAGCRFLITEDLDHGRKLNDLTIVDPFEVPPASVLGTGRS